MYPDEIESVTQRPARGIRTMMGKSEFIIVNDQSSRRAPVPVRIAVIHVASLVDIGKERLDSPMYPVCPAEHPDNAGFLQGIRLFPYISPDHIALPIGHRPLGSVLPVMISSQYLIGGQPRPVLTLEIVLDIFRGRWPVHEPLGLICRVIKLIDTQIPGDPPGDGNILIGRDRAIQRDRQPQTGFLR